MREPLVLCLLVLIQFLVSGACRKTEKGPVMRGTDWEDVRSVPNGFGGTVDFVVIPESKQRDKRYYMQVSDTICGQRTSCMVDFWTDRKHIPKSAWINVEDLAVETASYERSPSYKGPSLHLACWLYPNKAVGEADECEYEPGAKKPPDISDVKSCAAKVVSQTPVAKPKTVRLRKGDKATGYSPIIAFEILESGDVMNAHVKRTSGIADLDAYALNSIQGTKYNKRIGCGTVETEADVLIHFQ